MIQNNDCSQKDYKEIINYLKQLYLRHLCKVSEDKELNSEKLNEIIKKLEKIKDIKETDIIKSCECYLSVITKIIQDLGYNIDTNIQLVFADLSPFSIKYNSKVLDRVLEVHLKGKKATFKTLFGVEYKKVKDINVLGKIKEDIVRKMKDFYNNLEAIKEFTVMRDTMNSRKLCVLIIETSEAKKVIKEQIRTIDELRENIENALSKKVDIRKCNNRIVCLLIDDISKLAL